ncbi:DM13 domain-containing protein [Desulfatitalea tepidiphila]|uniref:DM13 domain-containing protein n=1 Tax=Desulfatitalea tepidiphila TaxID=1185843 RepID=UPI0006B45E9B|nr:DM13 domain-containing protein [Desulfatitalea tepidiphila]
MTQSFWMTQILSAMMLIIGAAGLAGATDMMKDNPMLGMLTGTMDHHASGKVTLNQDMKGHTTLTLSDIKIDKIPDGYVFLAKDGDWRKGVELGMLKKFTGTVSFDLPMGVEAGDYDTVVIWCKKYKVEIGRAGLSDTMMK